MNRLTNYSIILYEQKLSIMMQKLNCIALQINVLGLVCIINFTSEIVITHTHPLSLSLRNENYTPMVQMDKRSHLVLFEQNQRNHDPYTSELQKR